MHSFFCLQDIIDFFYYLPTHPIHNFTTKVSTTTSHSEMHNLQMDIS